VPRTATPGHAVTSASIFHHGAVMGDITNFYSTLPAINIDTALWLEAGPWQRIGRLAWIIAAGAAAYFATLFLLGFRFADFARREG